MPNPATQSDQMPSYWVQSDETLTLNRFGTWLANGLEIEHDPTQKAFSRKIQKDAEGYFIQLGHEKKRIQVEDTAYFIRRIDGDPESGFQLWVSDETQERLDPPTLGFQPGRLTCRLLRGEEARILQPAYMDLMRYLEEDENGYFIRFGSTRVELAKR